VFQQVSHSNQYVLKSRWQGGLALVLSLTIMRAVYRKRWCLTIGKYVVFLHIPSSIVVCGVVVGNDTVVVLTLVETVTATGRLIWSKKDN